MFFHIKLVKVKKVWLTRILGVEAFRDSCGQNVRLVSHHKQKIQSAALFSSQKILQNFLDFPSHQIFRRTHKVLNIDENKI